MAMIRNGQIQQSRLLAEFIARAFLPSARNASHFLSDFTDYACDRTEPHRTVIARCATHYFMLFSPSFPHQTSVFVNLLLGARKEGWTRSYGVCLLAPFVEPSSEDQYSAAYRSPRLLNDSGLSVHLKLL
jgi:hypothetical protein